MLVEVHSKDFVIQWLNVPAQCWLQYKVIPLKKSINFVVFERASTAGEAVFSETLASSSGTLHERLAASGLELVPDQDVRRLQANEMEEGAVVPRDPSKGGLFAFVFDNRFSKSTAKTIECTFSVHEGSPQSGGHSLESQVSATPKHLHPGVHAPSKRRSTISSVMAAPALSSDGRYLTGVLLKKRRKNFQGYARRYFMLDTRLGLLNYYLDQKSSFLRGVMPVKICDVTSNPLHREVMLDSGVEKWSLKALDDQAFAEWSRAFKQLQQAGLGAVEAKDDLEDSHVTRPGGVGLSVSHPSAQSKTEARDEPKVDTPASEVPTAAAIEEPAQHKDQQLEDVTSKAATDLQAILPSLPAEQRRRVARVIRELQRSGQNNISDAPSESESEAEEVRGENVDEALPEPPINPNHNLTQLGSRGAWIGGTAGLIGGILTGSLVGAVAVAAAGAALGASTSVAGHHSKEVVSYDELLEDSDNYSSADASDDSDVGEEDAASAVHVGFVPRSSRPLAPAEFVEALWVPEKPKPSTYKGFQPDSSDPTQSSEAPSAEATTEKAEVSPEDHAETSLYPLPHPVVTRRHQIRGPTWPIPSLMSMVKKGSSGSASAPAAANEPISLLQRIGEMYLGAESLDHAAAAAPGSPLRVMHVALFALAYVVGNISKERAMRKPFTPLLGETYEMAREDLQFRLVAEKVVHKPLVVATQAESPNWTVHFTARPYQKMWAKTVQMVDPGPVRVTFPDGESVTFILPELFLRNILAGERYIEPSGSTSVESSSGQTATIEFKSNGVFGGRSEDLKIISGSDSSLVFSGKWTDQITSKGKVVWKAPALVENPAKHYGWLRRTAELNEITAIERDALAPTDSRLRLDQRAMEENNIDRAEEVKADLEQRQRDRRRDMENAHKQWESQFFAKSSDAHGYYALHTGSRNYWVRRQAQNWEGITRIF